MIDYRSRWQRQRRRKTNIRRAIAGGVLALSIAVVLVVMLTGRRPTAWSRQPITGGIPRFTMADGKLFVAWSNGLIRVLQPMTGHQTGLIEYELPFAFFSAPTVQSGILVIGGHDFKVRAISAETGHVCWKYETDGPVQARPVIDHEQVLVGSSDGHLYCLDLPTGALIWKADCAGGVATSVALAGEIVVAGTVECRLVGISRGSGQRLFMVGTEAAVLGPLVAIDEHTVTAGCDDGRQYILDVRRPEQVSSIEVGGLLRLRPIVGEGTLYIASSSGRLLAANRETGQPLWQKELDETLTSGLASSEHYLCVGTAGGQIFAVERRTGRIRRRWQFDQPVIGSLAVGNGLLVAGLADGSVVAVSLPD